MIQQLDEPKRGTGAAVDGHGGSQVAAATDIVIS
jgi:hypothetical protein